MIDSPDKTLVREFKENPKHPVYSTIKEYLFFNSSEKEYKVKMKFGTTDDFINSYIPKSEITISLQAKENYFADAFTFLREDVNLPWNEIIITDMKLEDKQTEKESEFEKTNIPKVPGPLPIMAGKVYLEEAPTPTPPTDTKTESEGFEFCK